MYVVTPVLPTLSFNWNASVVPLPVLLRYPPFEPFGLDCGLLLLLSAVEPPKKALRSGRSVAIAEAVIPIPVSTVDQMATSPVA